MNGVDPGFPWCDDELESAMDVEWAGATATTAYPEYSGFSSGTGYDEATGLGSVDASVLVNHWSAGTQLNFTLSPECVQHFVGAGRIERLRRCR